jgi:hypothetical protein
MISLALMEMTDIHHWIRYLKQRCGKTRRQYVTFWGNLLSMRLSGLEILMAGRGHFHYGSRPVAVGLRE